MSETSKFPGWRGTTIIGVSKGGKVALVGDGQVSLGQTVIKGTARKVRRISPGGFDVLCGFAGSTADAFTLLERLEKKLEAAPGQLARASVELAKDWRMDKYLRNLEAMLIVTDGKDLLVITSPGVQAHYQVRAVEPKDWNAEWERSFQPVEIDGRVRIRAEFHAPEPGFEHELIITPRMAFGTGHHATTRMMVRAMLDLDLKGGAVCDLGCGTGVLAILAERLGAVDVHAVDIDERAVENTRDNLVANGSERVHVEKGTVEDLRGRKYGTILANIERNTLMRDMQAMHDALIPGGALLLGGFVVNDRHMVVQSAREAGLTMAERMNEGEWALLGCRRPH